MPIAPTTVFITAHFSSNVSVAVSPSEPRGRCLAAGVDHLGDVFGEKRVIDGTRLVEGRCNGGEDAGEGFMVVVAKWKLLNDASAANCRGCEWMRFANPRQPLCKGD